MKVISNTLLVPPFAVRCSLFAVHQITAQITTEMSGEMDLNNLSLEQLAQFKQQEEQKLQSITSHYSSLKSAQARFIQSQSTLSTLTPSTLSKPVMVPLTQSLYVSATVLDPSKVMVELGTGFYCLKSPLDAQKFMERKVALVGKNADNLYNVVVSTRKNIEAVVMTMQGKMDQRSQMEAR